MIGMWSIVHCVRNNDTTNWVRVRMMEIKLRNVFVLLKMCGRHVYVNPCEETITFLMSQRKIDNIYSVTIRGE